jgi:hypothetical protein
MVTTTLSPEGQLQGLQERLAAKQARLEELEAMLPDAEREYAASVAFSDDDGEAYLHRDTVTELEAEIRATTGALVLIEQHIEEVSVLVEERRVRALIERAEALALEVHELARPLPEMVEAFAREYAPVIAAVRAKRSEQYDAVLEALRAQGLPNEEVFHRMREQFELVIFSPSGFHQLEQALDGVVNTIANREQAESFNGADHASELVSAD